MSNYLDQWVEYLKNEEKSKCTIDAYSKDITQLFDFTGKDITEINKEDINQYKQHLIDEGMNVKTLNRKIVSIRSFINFLNGELELGVNLYVKTEKIQDQQYLENVITVEEYNKLVNYLEKHGHYRLFTILKVLAMTGMRISECLQMKVSDVGKEAIFIKGKGSKYREVFIIDSLQIVLQEYLKHRIARDTEFLFTSQTSANGRVTRSTIDTEMKKYGTKVRIKKDRLHCHNLRHLFCLNAINNDISISELADIVGHSNVNTTRIYIKKTKEQLMNKMSSISL